MHPAFVRNGHGDSRPALGRALDGKAAADQIGALAHADNAKAVIGLPGESIAVIPDDESHAVFAAAQIDMRETGVRMTEDVRQRLLGDAVDGSDTNQCMA
jgi:hypothetical protein